MMQTTNDYSMIMKNREHFYHFLSRLFEREVSAGLLDQLKAMDIPEDGGLSEMTEGYQLIKSFLTSRIAAVKDPKLSLEDELAVDYAHVFLGAGEVDGKAAYPYESVYTSKEGLIMQEAWSEVKAIYAQKGLELTTDMADLKEDHIAMELQYMACLCNGFSNAQPHAGIKEQLTFLEAHLKNWSTDFCEDVFQYAQTDFYKGLAKLTSGYLASEQLFLQDLIKETEKPSATSYSLSTDEMDLVLKNLQQQYNIYAPTMLKNCTVKGKNLVRYKEIHSVQDIVYNRPSDFSAKEVYYPIMQTMIYFTSDSCEESQLKEDKDLLLFLHPCDINAMRRLDNIFLNNGGHADSYYERLRRKVKVVMMECCESYENCFCVSMNANTADNYDLAVRLGDKEIKVQVKEEAFISYFKDCFASDFMPSFITKNEKSAVIPVIKDHETLKTASTLPYWNKFDDQCISCGGCNTVCPTCACFDTVDITYDETSRDGERRRVWSSCMLDTFTMTAGGGRARKTPGANMRFKALHKLYDYRKRFGGTENMCVGCGRCVGQCPENISFFDTINEFHDELEAAKKITGVSNMENIMLPSPHKIIRILKETKAEYTFRVECDKVTKNGQFFQLSIPKIGEAPISVSGKGDGYVEFTIRKIGRLTEGIFGLAEGDILFMRGPYGNSFPIEQFENKDLLVICGGTGVAPIKTTINHFYHHPEICKSVHIIAGFKDIDSVLFTEELEKFSKKFNTIYTLDNSEAPGFHKGFVTEYIKQIPIQSFTDYNIVIVGPPAMMNFAAKECLANQAEEAKIWVSFERKMSCAVGKCGHCKINETYVCLDGPVFNYTKAKTLFD